jgi:hypothetical protein
MKASLLIGIVLFVLGVGLGLVQLWFAPWDGGLFFKMEMTIGALLLIVVVVAFVLNEYKDDKATRSGDRLDN